MRPQPASYRYGPDPAQYGELWLPDSGGAGHASAGHASAGHARADHPGTVVIIHGGFWRARYGLELGRPLAADLAARGYAAWNLEYRRARAGGGWPETFADIAAGIDLLATLPVGISKVAAIGHSAGGQLAVWAAGRPKLPAGAPGAGPRVPLHAVISQAGVLTLADCARDHTGKTAAQDLMGGEPDDLPHEYRLADPITAIPLDVPVRCLHSRRDDNVPYGYSERYVAEAASAGADARLRETFGDHFTLIDPSTEDWGAAVKELSDLLPAHKSDLSRFFGQQGEPGQRRPKAPDVTPAPFRRHPA